MATYFPSSPTSTQADDTACAKNPTGSGSESYLAKLIWLDDDFIAKEALPDVFGDRFLCVNNALFARIRNLCLSSGLRYSCEPTRFWLDYNSFSLLMLQEILDSGVIPYKSNLPTLRRFLDRNPSLDIPANLLFTVFQHNYVLHESAHCVSYRVLSSYFNLSGPSTDKQLYVLVAILCEAYANMVERVGAALATTDAHRLFYTLNSFADCRPDVSALLNDSIRVFGFYQTFMLGTLAFVYLNTHDNPPNHEEVETIIGAAFAQQALADVERAFLKVVIKQGLGLSKKFRTETTPVFFRYLGCEKEYEWLCGQPFSTETLSTLGVLDAATELTSITCQNSSIGAPDCNCAASSQVETGSSRIL